MLQGRSYIYMSHTYTPVYYIYTMQMNRTEVQKRLTNPKWVSTKENLLVPQQKTTQTENWYYLMYNFFKKKITISSLLYLIKMINLYHIHSWQIYNPAWLQDYFFSTIRFFKIAWFVWSDCWSLWLNTRYTPNQVPYYSISYFS